MDHIPLLKSKLIVPEIPGRILFSSRIKNLNITGYRVTIITAPAGFGKTTAVLLSLRKDRDNIRWYRMEKEDSFLPVFYAHLIETLFGHEDKDITDSARCLASIGKISEEFPLLNAVICQDAWTLYPEINSPIYMIFDDFQNVVDNAAIVETIRYFISNLPPNIRIIVMSRVDTGIRAGKLTLNRDILLIDEQALCFSEEEIAKLTSDIYKIKIDPDDTHTMYEYSEGWIAGITLLLHAAEPNLCNLGKLLTNDNRQNLFRYLLNEAFSGTDQDMMKTLASISLLPDFTCDDLKAVFNMENAAATIAWLERNNIYIQKTKTKITSYRFHSLFRSALLSVLNDLFTPAEINRMNLNAAYHYKSLGDFSSAIRFLIAAGRTDEAIGIAPLEGVQLIDSGDTDRVTSIIHAFPEECIESDPFLLFLRGATLMSTELDQSYEYLYRAFMNFRRSSNLDLQTRALGLMISISYQKNDLKSIRGIISQINKFKAVIMSKYARVTLLISAFMNAVWSDKLASGNILCKLVERQGIYEPLWEYTFKMAKVILLYRKGDLESAREIIEKLPIHPISQANDHWRTIGLVSCHNITSLMGDTGASQKLVGQLASLGEKYNSDYARAYALRLAAYTKYQTRDIAGAVSQMDESSGAFDRYGSPIMAYVQRMTKYLWEAEYAPAEPLCKKASLELDGLGALKPGLGFIELCWANVGALFKEAGSYAEAEGLLIKAYKVSKGKKACQSMCGAAMHLADLYYRKKEYSLEEKYLRIWGKTAADNRYLYFREMNYPTLVRVCARCIEKDINPDYMLRVIGKYFDTTNAARLAEAPARNAADPKEFISGCSPSLQKTKVIRIKLFGTFKLVVDDVEIGEKEWKTRKICGILKYILANPDRTVSREALTAAFWPESDSKAAYTSLRVALFELRKILARFGMAFESEDALLAEGKNGFHLCSRNTIETDAGRFAGLYEKYNSESLSPREMQDLLVQMIGLYEGDFLEEDLYNEWTVLSREHYKSIFIEVSHKLAGLYIGSGESEQAEALLTQHMKVDPFDEKACSILIHLYNSTGRKNQASSLRRQFVKRFETEMGVKPDFKYP